MSLSLQFSRASIEQRQFVDEKRGPIARFAGDKKENVIREVARVER